MDDTGGLACLVDAAARLEPIAETNVCPKLSLLAKKTRHGPSWVGRPSDIITDDDESKPCSQTRKKSKALPLMLMSLLMDRSHSNVLVFLPDGATFAFVDVVRFENFYLKDLFKMARFETFERKLELWGFRRDSYVSTEGCRKFYHPEFRKGDWDACRKIRCGKRSRTFIFATDPAVPLRVPTASVCSSYASTLRSGSASPGTEREILNVPQEIVVPSEIHKVPTKDAHGIMQLELTGSGCHSTMDITTQRIMSAALEVLVNDRFQLQQNRTHLSSMNPMNPMQIVPGFVPASQRTMSMHLRMKLMMQRQRRQALRCMFP